MNYFLMNLAGAVLKGAASLSTTYGTGTNEDVILKFVYDLRDAVNIIIWPLMILVGAAGSIYSVVLGVNMAKADSGEKEKKQRRDLLLPLLV